MRNIQYDLKQRQQKNIQEIQNDSIKMEEIAQQSSIRERKATDAEREVEDMKKAEFMEQHIGKKFNGVISGLANFGFFVQLTNTVEEIGRAHV